jgi:2,5-diamino-6-(ribosylamino)-4(3H)-pyrimidinone 5'-phosphate reductase
MAPQRGALTFPNDQASLLEPYIPMASSPTLSQKPFLTLTYATSLDNCLSLSPGVQTALSGPQSKAMTHYLRCKHDAILVGCGTAIADNPSLNCRIDGVGGYGGEGLNGQPRPVVIDPQGRWNVGVDSKVIQLAKEGSGRAPWILTLVSPSEEKREILESVGGKFVVLEPSPEDGKLDWNDILRFLANQKLGSVMVEGGGAVIQSLLSPRYLRLIDSVIITIAPTWLGRGGVTAQPEERLDEQGKKVAVGRLQSTRWVPLGEDVVLCGRPQAGAERGS